MTDEVHGQVGDKHVKSAEDGEIKEVCEPCLVGDKNKPAVGWCETCDELLCEDCYDGHCRQKLMRNHQLIPLEDMKALKQLKPVATTCYTHAGETFSYFCEDHEELCCSYCFVDKHRLCVSIMRLSDLSVSGSEEFEKLKELMNQLKQRLVVDRESVKRNITIVNQQPSTTVKCIKDYTSKLHDYLKKLMDKKLTEAGAIKDADLENMRDLEDFYADIATTLTADEMVLSRYENAGNERALFIVMKNVHKELEVIETQMREAKTKNSVKRYKFVLNKNLSNIFTHVTEIGRFQGAKPQERTQESFDDELHGLKLPRSLDRYLDGSWDKKKMRRNVKKNRKQRIVCSYSVPSDTD